MRPTQALLLLVALVWGIPMVAHGDNHCPESTDVHIRFAVDRPIELDRATFPKKLLWAGILLINPDDQYKLTPLFSYPVSALRSPFQMRDALTEAKTGNVRIAILRRSGTGSDSENGDIYKGWGVHVPDDIDEHILSCEWDKLLKTKDLPSHALVAFTRPLRGMTPTEEFVAGSNLWADWGNTQQKPAVEMESTMQASEQPL